MTAPSGRSARPRLPVIVFVNAGDPDLRTTERLLRRLDRLGVAGVELCVPYAEPFTDGATIRRSHARALAQQVILDDVLALVGRLAPTLTMRLYLMADWSHTVKPIGLEAFVQRVAAVPVAGLLLHGLPALVRARYAALAAAAGIAPVATVYLSGSEAALREGCAGPASFVYLVSQYGPAGGQGGFSEQKLAALRAVRGLTAAPLFVGFGIQSDADVRAVLGAGADGVVVGSAFVAAIEPHLDDADGLLAAAESFVTRLCGDLIPEESRS